MEYKIFVDMNNANSCDRSTIDNEIREKTIDEKISLAERDLVENCGEYTIELEEAIRDICRELKELLAFKQNLVKEIPTLKSILAAQYEIFDKFKPFESHTEIEQIAWNESGKIMQDMQWLLDELEKTNED